MLARGSKILALSLALVLSFSFWGCTEVGGLSQEEIDRLVANTIDAYPEVTTVKFDMDMLMTLEVTGGTDPMKMTMAMGGSGAIDSTELEMQMTMDMMMDIPGLFKESMTTDCYIVGEWMYVKVAIPGVGEEWVREKVTADVWQEQFDTTQIEQQIEFLKTATLISYLGSETVNGADCYIFEVLPDMGELMGVLSEQQEATGLDFSSMPDLGDLFQEMSLKMWIAKDSYQTMKTDLYMMMEMLPGYVGATEDDFTRMTIVMSMTMSLYDYDEPVSITIPPEALVAVKA